MSTKTIALETSVYEKLARRKRDGESFTKTINRLVETEAVSGTCEDAVHTASRIWKRPPTVSEIEAMEQVVRENRTDTVWDVETPS
jgi:predicted CopG family antitoxin